MVEKTLSVDSTEPVSKLKHFNGHLVNVTVHEYTDDEKSGKENQPGTNRTVALSTLVDDNGILGTIQNSKYDQLINSFLEHLIQNGCLTNNDFVSYSHVITAEVTGKQYECKSKAISLKTLQEKLPKYKKYVACEYLAQCDKMIIEGCDKLPFYINLFHQVRKQYFEEMDPTMSAKRTKMLNSMNEDVLKGTLTNIVEHYMMKCADKDLFSIPSKVILPDFVFHPFSDCCATRLVSKTTDRHPTTVLKNSSMEVPLMRIFSFRNWSNASSVSALKLSDAGFYCLDPVTETVDCHSCELTFKVSEMGGTDPMAYHIQRSPDCVFVRENKQKGSNQSTSIGDRVSETESLGDGAVGFDRKSNTGLDKTNETTNKIEQQRQGRSLNSDIDANPHNSNTNSSLTPPGNELSTTQPNISVDSPRPRQTISDHDVDSVTLLYSNTIGRDTTGSSATIINNNSFETGIAINNNQIVNYNTNPLNNVTSSVQILNYPPRNPEYVDLNTRMSTFRYWHQEQKPNSDSLAEAGFYFTGVTDTVRCFQCDIGLAEWNQEDDPWVEHARHSPECPFLTSHRDRTFIENIQSAWSRVYSPKHAHMTEYDARLNTFQNSSWPRDYVAQTPEQIATAGFFYTGNGDTVRCHYCDGGLREWEPQDNPWTEHARWFPFCKFVIRNKGMEFIRMAASGEADEIREPQLPAAYNNTPNVPLTISYEDQCKRKEQRNPLYSAAAESVMFSTGYSRAKVKKAINVYIERTGRRDFKAVDLMDIILDKEENGCPLSSDDDDDSRLPNNRPSAAMANVEDEEENDEFQLTPEAIRKENERLRELYICVVCKERERSMLYVPCGHRMVCEECSHYQDACYHCKTAVKQKIKTYFG